MSMRFVITSPFSFGTDYLCLLFILLSFQEVYLVINLLKEPIFFISLVYPVLHYFIPSALFLFMFICIYMSISFLAS